MAELNYGGQAVMEGVMMRGSRSMAVAVRQPDGEITIHTEPLNPSIYAGTVSKVPFLRAMTSLWDVLVLGIRTLMYSAEVALGPEEEIEFDGPLAWGTVAVSFAIGIGIFFVGPLLLVGVIDRYIESSFVSNVIEGVIRMTVFVIYIWLIGLLPDIRRVFAYHGAEHKAVNTYEDGIPLEVESAKGYNTAHRRCGTSFLFVVLIIAIVVFALIGRPSLLIMVLSRILLIPVIAALGYEVTYFGANHIKNVLVRVILAPGLLLQALTTREPDDSQLEVALTALKTVVETDQLEEAPQTVP